MRPDLEKRPSLDLGMAPLALLVLRHIERRFVRMRYIGGRSENGAEQEPVPPGFGVLVEQVVVGAAALARELLLGAARLRLGAVTWAGGRQVGRRGAEAGARPRRGRHAGGRQLRARALVHGGGAPRLALHAVRRDWKAMCTLYYL